jgi:hypothetical protein
MKLEVERMKGRAVLCGGLMWVAASASAQGVFSFDDIPIDREPTVEVNMGPEMINLLAGAAQVPGGAPGTGPLDGITNVRVLVYEDINEDMQAVVRFVESTGTRLEGDGWHAVVRVRDGDEQVRVYMRPGTDGTLAGVTVMVMDSGGDGGAGEAVFLNVAGTIHPAQLGQIASSMGMHGMFRGVPVIPASDPYVPQQ